MLQLGSPKASLPLSNNRRNGDGRATQLARETESFVCRPI